MKIQIPAASNFEARWRQFLILFGRALRLPPGPEREELAWQIRELSYPDDMTEGRAA